MSKRIKGQRLKLFCVAIFSTLSFLLCFLTAIYLALGYYLFTFSLDATFAATSNIPRNVNIEMPEPLQKSEWFESVEKKEIYIPSYDGYNLHAYEIKQNSDKWAICVHGYRGKGEGMSLYAYQYYKEGYNVLLPDLKGHGKSEGKYVGMGYNDRRDLLLWINRVIVENPNCQIVLHGVSMGAATVMMTCGEDLPKNVKVAVEDCGYTSVYDQYSNVANGFLKTPLTIFALSALDAYAKLKTGVNIKSMNSVAQLKKSKTPMLFIHGDADDFVPFYMLEEVYNANDRIIKEKYVVHGATHAYSASYDTVNYFNKVFEFTSQFIS